MVSPLKKALKSINSIGKGFTPPDVPEPKVSGENDVCTAPFTVPDEAPTQLPVTPPPFV